jgi:Ca-activated chloride channel homolog
MTGTLVTVAKDVKIQMDFNPSLVRAYRLIGYEDRKLSNADFNNDKKDAGDIGAGHCVTALYEIVPTPLVAPNTTASDSESKYTKPPVTSVPAVDASEWLTLKIRYKKPEGSESTKLEFVLKNPLEDSVANADRDFQWAASVAEFGLLLRNSRMAPDANWSRMIERAKQFAGSDEYRIECIELMRNAGRMKNPGGGN